MRKKEKKRIRDSVVAVIFITLLLSGSVFVVMFCMLENVRADYESKLEVNDELIYSNTRQVYVACQEIRVGEIIEPEMLEIRRTVCSQDENLLFTQQDIGKEAIMPIPKGTFLSRAMVNQSGEVRGLREMCYRMIDLTENVNDYDVVDIRIRYPNGSDYIVLAGKRIRMDGNAGNCYLRVSEEEILLMSAAMVDSAENDGTFIYTSKYIEPTLQKKSVVTYSPPQELVGLICESPNILLTEKGGI